MKIEVIGSGCKKCKALLENVEIALKRTGEHAEILYVTDLEKIALSGVLQTPALKIDNTIVSQGKVLAPIEIELIIHRFSNPK